MPTVEILKKRVGAKGNYTTIKVTSDVSLDDSAEFKRIQNRMNQLLDEELEKDQTETSSYSESVTPRNPKDKPASEKQIRCLKAIMRERHLSETDLCRENHVACIDDLSSKTCWQIIDGLKHQ